MQANSQRWADTLLGRTDGLFWDEPARGNMLWPCICQSLQPESPPISGPLHLRLAPLRVEKNGMSAPMGWGEVIYFYHYLVIQIVEQKTLRESFIQRSHQNVPALESIVPKWLFQRLWSQNSCLIMAASKWPYRSVCENSPIKHQVPGVYGDALFQA